MPRRLSWSVLFVVSVTLTTQFTSVRHSLVKASRDLYVAERVHLQDLTVQAFEALVLALGIPSIKTSAQKGFSAMPCPLMLKAHQNFAGTA